MNRLLLLLIFCALPVCADAAPASQEAVAVSQETSSTLLETNPVSEPFRPDFAFLTDRLALDRLQRETFDYMWEDAHPVSGMAFESSEPRDPRPVTSGGTGFGIAAIVVGVDRGWITREQAVTRLGIITSFLRDKTARKFLHGAFPHWLDGTTGETLPFSKEDTGADIVETALLMQGLLIARAYFNGPGIEEELRAVITKLWEDVDWNWFTNGEENGLYWHWSPDNGFSINLKIQGYNESLIAYLLAAGSPTHPISRKVYDHWTSGKGYQPKSLYGYTVPASLPGGGPLFLAHYSFIGLDPRRMADAFVPEGYFLRNVNHTLSNRSYCVFVAPARNQYSEKMWGLTASQIKGGYAANEPAKDSGTIAPTAALSSMPYTPHYSMQVLEALLGSLREKVWGKNGPYDAFNLRDKWFCGDYLAIDQLTIVCMVENYRTGLLWRLLMDDVDVRRGLDVAGIVEPLFGEGFPEAVVTLTRNKKNYVPDAYDMRRHPDSGLYVVPYWTVAGGIVTFSFLDDVGTEIHVITAETLQGRNILSFPQFIAPDAKILTLTMKTGDGVYSLPVRLH